ncbi:hypothetical protein U9M48_031823 [Paspalum notatum var. saurae]|uniref:CMP/dCMP-type deaminase domain-containing protein n=1 Tax=Paspalum notatum var. saurae TaxID=547442 RepID=A0AAQ3X4T2_PASNO
MPRSGGADGVRDERGGGRARRGGGGRGDRAGPTAAAGAVRGEASAPLISRFLGGAVGLGASGRVYVSVNLEFRSLPLCHSVHAEQFLVANAAAAGEPALRAITVSHMPCGHCRQFLQEIRGAAGIQILVTTDALPVVFMVPDCSLKSGMLICYHFETMEEMQRRRSPTLWHQRKP